MKVTHSPLHSLDLSSFNASELKKESLEEKYNIALSSSAYSTLGTINDLSNKTGVQQSMLTTSGDQMGFGHGKSAEDTGDSRAAVNISQRGLEMQTNNSATMSAVATSDENILAVRWKEKRTFIRSGSFNILFNCGVCDFVP